MEEFQSNSKSSLLEFAIAEPQPILDEVNFRANESKNHACSDYAECSLSWTKSEIVFFQVSGYSD